MRDRVPAPGKANRVKITLDNGQVVEGVLSYADDATQEGSAYNKANVLPDDVCEDLGIDPATAEPKDAFQAAGDGLTQLTNIKPAFASDFYLYITGQHPILSAHPANDYFQYRWAMNRPWMERETALTGDAQTLTTFDGSFFGN